MVTEGGSSKRVAISIHWGLMGGGGAGELHNIAHLFHNRKKAKGKMPRIQEWEPGMQCREAGGVHPSPPSLRQHITETYGGDFMPSLHRLSRNVVTMLRHVLLRLFDSYLTVYIFFNILVAGKTAVVAISTFTYDFTAS